MPREYGLAPLAGGELAWLVQAASLHELTRRLRLKLDARQSTEVVRTTKRFFEEAHPDYKLRDCCEWEDYKVLVRRECVLALTEVLCGEINTATERLAPIDIEIGVDVEGLIRPKASSSETEEGRLQAVDPLRWGYQELVGLSGRGKREPSEQELALIRLERVKDVMVSSEKAIGGVAKMRVLVAAICSLNRELV